MKDTISMYNYFIEFYYKKNNKFDRLDKERMCWTTSKEIAQKAMEKDVDKCNHNDLVIVKAVNYGVYKKEIPKKMIFEGILQDNGEWYEDFEITIDDKAVFEEMYNKFCGNKFRVTFELLE